MTPEKPLACICLPLEPELEARIEASCRLERVSWAAPLDELIEAVRDADGLLISNRLPIGDELFAAAPKLRVLAGVGVGYDAFDVAAATKRGIAVSNTPDVLTHAVADLVLGLLFALSRSLLENAEYVRSGGWSQAARPPGLGFDVRDRTLGVVGMGRIGRVVTERAQALGMRTLWNDVFSELPSGAPQSEYRELPDLLRESDVVSLHTDLNPTSHHLIGADELACMQPHAVLINTSRGPVVDPRGLRARRARAGAPGRRRPHPRASERTARPAHRQRNRADPLRDARTRGAQPAGSADRRAAAELPQPRGPRLTG